MYARCAECGKQLKVPPVCTTDMMPNGWQILLDSEGERWFCGHGCAALWHAARATAEAGVLSLQQLPCPPVATPRAGRLGRPRLRPC